MEKNINNTQFFTVQKEPELQVSDVLEIVYKALKERATILLIRLLDILCPEIQHISQATITREVSS